ncbi:Vinculin [Parelaphostrongylus tenuis]|uniref:Vinculin n=1 Tax=Parelaphostrongylus tenuis TaxID=148309 RepID=A0AAD5MWY4_PARTN|nr:Vinculin [Parelaphostrongylus tenuis]
MRSLAPLTLLSGRTLCQHPSSRIARENLEVFCDTWSQSVNDLSRLAKESDSAACGRVAAEKQAYMSLPRPGKHGTTSKPSKPITLDIEDQQKMAKVGLEMKLLTSEVDAEAEKWDEYAENDIVKRAKAMSSMAYNMYLFTRGDGPLKTTHDLFTQAEFFAEQANKMYKTVREFSYEVPASAEKSELSTILERIPAHCQQLQVLVKSPTVGKSATFGKVDSVIQETKNLMNEIAKLVTSSFVCATKYEIEFRGGSMPRPVGDGGVEPRTSRESTAWRRTPSIRRTAPPPTYQQH